MSSSAMPSSLIVLRAFFCWSMILLRIIFRFWLLELRSFLMFWIWVRMRTTLSYLSRTLVNLRSMRLTYSFSSNRNLLQLRGSSSSTSVLTCMLSYFCRMLSSSSSSRKISLSLSNSSKQSNSDSSTFMMPSITMHTKMSSGLIPASISRSTLSAIPVSVLFNMGLSSLYMHTQMASSSPSGFLRREMQLSWWFLRSSWSELSLLTSVSFSSLYLLSLMLCSLTAMSMPWGSASAGTSGSVARVRRASSTGFIKATLIMSSILTWVMKWRTISLIQAIATNCYSPHSTTTTQNQKQYLPSTSYYTAVDFISDQMRQVSRGREMSWRSHRYVAQLAQMHEQTIIKANNAQLTFRRKKILFFSATRLYVQTIVSIALAALKLRHLRSTLYMRTQAKWEEPHTAQREDKKSEPLPSEIQQSIIAIQNRFGHISAFDLVAALYRNVVINKTPLHEMSPSSPYVKQDSGQIAVKLPDPLIKTQPIQKMTFTIVTKQPKVKEPKINEAKVKVQGKQFHQLQAEADAQQDYDDTSSKAPSRERAKRRYNFNEYTEINRTNLLVAESWDTSANKEHRIYCFKVTPTFEKEQQQQKYYEKRNTALAYISKGHGFVEGKGNPEDYVPYLTDKKKQKTMEAAFLNDTIRKFEYFLVTECSLKLRPITGPEMKALFPFFLAPDLSLSEDEYLIFRRFIKITFQIGSASIYQRAAQLLYIKIQLVLQGKIELGERKEEKKRQEKKEKQQKAAKKQKGKKEKGSGTEAEFSFAGSEWSGMLEEREEYDPYPQQDDFFF